jgi:hypothetical protein
MTNRTFFGVTAPQMELPFDYRAIVARPGIGAPVFRLFAITNPREYLTANRVRQIELSTLNVAWPLRIHLDALKNDSLSFHGLTPK